MTMEIQADEAEKIIKSIAIPPRPAVILKVMEERNRPEPDLGKVARLIGGDVGLSAAMMKTVNSPFYGLRSKVSSVQHAVSMLGLSSVSNVATALSLRSSLAGSKAVSMEQFWDTSSQIATISAHAAASLPGVSQEQAYTFGLFRDCGIPVLMQKFPDYKNTLLAANTASDQAFTAVEDARHGTNHATVGYLLAKSWCLDEVISKGILLHHDDTIFQSGDSALSQVCTLVAISLLAEHISNTYMRLQQDAEWDRRSATVLGYLGLPLNEYEDMQDEIHRRLDQAA